MLAPAAVEQTVESFAALGGTPVIQGFVGRVPGIDVSVDRAEALARLDGVHQEVRRKLGLSGRVFVTAEQVHGHAVTVLPTGAELPPLPCRSADGVITNRPDVCLGIYVADCCAVYLVDTRQRAIGLVHSGKKGTELGIVPRAIDTMRAHFGTRAEDLVVQLAPCIRPPRYEVDFAAEIVRQCRDAGVTRVTAEAACTAANPDHYYSYRREKGRTGRMLALLALR